MIGIDVGGANVKIVDEDRVYIHYCPLWEHAPLTDILRQYAGDSAAVVMSGEQADAFSTKLEGIAYIVAAVKKVFPEACFYGMDGQFHRTAVPQLSAANWLAAADYLRVYHPDSILVDMGSTTTDIIPLAAFEDLKNMADLARLKKGYLVYTGLLRTPVPAILRSVMLEGTDTLISSECFAVSADVHLVLGHINTKDYSIPAPDGAEKSIEASMHRLARLVCADLEEIGMTGAETIARQFWKEQRRLIHTRITNLMDESGSRTVVTAGIGSGLCHEEFGGTDLRDELGDMCDALPAYAVRGIALRTAGR